MHTNGVDKITLCDFNVILSTPIVCIVLVIINIYIILHGHTVKLIVAFQNFAYVPKSTTHGFCDNIFVV